MAKLSHTTEDVVVTRAEPRVVLTITEDEARALASVLGRVGGNPHSTRRGKIDGMWYALNKAGYVSEGERDVSGTVYFGDQS